MNAEAAGPGNVPAFVAASAPWAPLVGRDRELDALRAALAGAAAGQGRLVLLSGAAGGGKTAVANSLARRRMRA